MHATYRYNTSWEKVRRIMPGEGPYTILDLGCGDGSIVEPLLAEHTVWGLDTDPQAIKAAYAKGIHAVKGSIEQPFPFPDHQCDIVLALDIVEHVADLAPVLQEIHRVVKPDGWVIISIPNHFDLRTRLDILRGKGIIKWSQTAYEKKSWEYAHLRFWTLPEFREMLAQYGLYPEQWQYNFMMGGLFPTWLIPKWKRRFLIRYWPGLFSGKFVVRCRMRPCVTKETLSIDTTPENF